MAEHKLHALVGGLSNWFFNKKRNNTIEGHTYPVEASTLDLGSALKPFRAIYADSLIGSGGGAATDELVKVNASDAAAGYLGDKISVTSPLTKSTAGDSAVTLGLSLTPFLLRDGSQSLTGNLAVATGITIDGVDLGSPGNGIEISSNAYRVRLSAIPGLEFNSGALQAKVDSSLTLGASGIGVNKAHDFTWTGQHQFNVAPKINANLAFIGLPDRYITSQSNLYITPTGGLVLDPTGNISMPNAQTFRSTVVNDLPTGIDGINVFNRYDDYVQMTIGAIKADELYVRVFVANETRIDRGEEYWSKSFGIVETDFNIPAVGATVDVWFEDAAALAGAGLFSANDYLLCRTIDWGQGLVVQKIWFQVVGGKLAQETTDVHGVDRQQWRLRRIQGGWSTTGPENVVKRGNVMLDAGQLGQGWIHLSALAQDGGPFIQMGEMTSVATVPQFTNYVRMGNLKNAAGYLTDTWGFVAGNNLGYDKDLGQFKGIVSEADNGLTLYNTDIKIFDTTFLALTMSQNTGLALLQDNTEFGNSNRTISWYDSLSTLATAHARISSWGTSDSRVLSLRSFGSGKAMVSLAAYGTGGTDIGTLTVKGSWDGKTGGIVDFGATNVRLVGGFTLGGDISPKFRIGGDNSQYAVSGLHLYESNAAVGTTTGITIEQAGIGDSLLHWYLTLGQRYVAGIDNSDGDKWKFSIGNTLGVNDMIVIDPSTGTVRIEGLEYGSSGTGLVAGTGITIAGATVSVDTTVVRTTRSVTGSSGITGGGSLDNNVVLSLDSSVVRTTRTINTENGIQGGGTLGADRTLSIKLPVDSGLTADATGLYVNSTIARSAITIFAGSGLSGGGNLTTDRTLSINLATTSGLNLTSGLAIDDSIAGAGLTITSKVLNVVALSTGGLTANANDIQIKLPSTAGLTTDATGLYVLLPTFSGLVRDATGLYINDSIAGTGLTITNKVLNVIAHSTGGLQSNANDIQILLPSTAGLTTDATGLYIKLPAISGLTKDSTGLYLSDSVAGAGLTITNKVLNVIATTAGGLKVNADDIQILIPSTGGLATDATGLYINMSAISGLSTDASGLYVKLPTYSGLVRDGTGLYINDNIAGAGLIITNKIIDIVAVSTGGLQVNANDIQIKKPLISGLVTDATGLYIDDSIAGAGLAISNKILSVNAVNGLQINGDNVIVDEAFDFEWVGNHDFDIGTVVFNTAPQVNNNLNFIGGARSITGVGNITLLPTGDLVLSPTSNDILPGGSYVTDLGDYNRKFRSLYVAELIAETLVARDVMATIGGRLVVSDTTTLVADFPIGATYIDVKHNNLANGAYVRLESAPGGVPQTEVLKLTSGPTDMGGYYRHTVARNQDESGGVGVLGENNWSAGDAIVNLGSASGTGYLDITSTSTIHGHAGPTITIYARNKNSSDFDAAWDDVSPVVTFGNLDSFIDYSSTEFGFAVGNDLTLDPSNGFSGMVADRNDGLRLFNTGMEFYDGITKYLELDKDKGLRLKLPDTSVMYQRRISWLQDVDEFIPTGTTPLGVTLGGWKSDYTVGFKVEAQSEETVGRSTIHLIAQQKDGPSSNIFMESTNGYTVIGSTLGTGGATLHVIEQTDNVSYGNGMLIEQKGTGDAKLRFLVTTSSREWTMGIDQSDSYKFKIGRYVDLGFSSDAAITIDRNNLYVGIGTTSPTAPLEVNGGATINGNIILAGDPSAVIARSNTNDTDAVFVSRRLANTVDRFRIESSGRLRWGAGSAALDTELYRGGSNMIRTPGSVIVDSSIGVATTFLPVGLIVNGSLAPTTFGGNIASAIRITNSRVTDFNEQSELQFAVGSYRPGAVIAGVYTSWVSASNLLGMSLVFATTTAQTGSGTPLERMRITHSGSVGINISNPSYQLHVSGDGRFTDNLSANTAFMGVGGHGAAYAHFSHTSMTEVNQYALLQNSSGATHLNSALGQILQLKINNTAIMTLSGTNVGIGTGVPGEKLEVNGSARVEGSFGVGGFFAASAAVLMAYQSSTTGNKPVLRLEQADVSEEFIEFVGTSGPFSTSAVGTYYGKVRVSVDGVMKWIALYN